MYGAHLDTFTQRSQGYRSDCLSWISRTKIPGDEKEIRPHRRIRIAERKVTRARDIVHGFYLSTPYVSGLQVSMSETQGNRCVSARVHPKKKVPKMKIKQTREELAECIGAISDATTFSRECPNCTQSLEQLLHVHLREAGKWEVVTHNHGVVEACMAGVLLEAPELAGKTAGEVQTMFSKVATRWQVWNDPISEILAAQLETPVVVLCEQVEKGCRRAMEAVGFASVGLTGAQVAGYMRCTRRLWQSVLSHHAHSRPVSTDDVKTLCNALRLIDPGGAQIDGVSAMIAARVEFIMTRCRGLRDAPDLGYFALVASKCTSVLEQVAQIAQAANPASPTRAARAPAPVDDSRKRRLDDKAEQSGPGGLVVTR